jgi:ArsR family transcriptional regulator
MVDAVSFNQSLADPTRWRIAMLVADQMLCVCELEDGLRLPQSTLSSHLTVMRASGLLEVERRGKWAFYRMASRARPLFETLRGHFAESLTRDPVFALDRKRTAERVALRGMADCGSPRRRAIPPTLVGASGAAPGARCC